MRWGKRRRYEVMIIYAPYLAVAFWGTMILLGLRSAFLSGKGPGRGLLREIDGKAGGLVWVPIVLLFLIVFFLARLDSETIRRMESPVGLYTGLSFVPLVAADALLAARLFLHEGDGG